MLYEVVANNIFLCKLDHSNATNILQPLNRIFESRLLAGREVNLRKVARDNHLAMYTQTRKEHFELRRSGILRLI